MIYLAVGFYSCWMYWLQKNLGGSAWECVAFRPTSRRPRTSSWHRKAQKPIFLHPFIPNFGHRLKLMSGHRQCNYDMAEEAYSWVKQQESLPLYPFFFQSWTHPRYLSPCLCSAFIIPIRPAHFPFPEMCHFQGQISPRQIQEDNAHTHTLVK